MKETNKNMKGVQCKIQNMYSWEHFVPCGMHSLNLVLNDASLSNLKAVESFRVQQKTNF